MWEEIVLEEILPDGPDTDAGVRYIENPLPLPKKHVKREMGFDRDVEETELHFDHAVEEADDFDI